MILIPQPFLIPLSLYKLVCHRRHPIISEFSLNLTYVFALDVTIADLRRQNIEYLLKIGRSVQKNASFLFLFLLYRGGWVAPPDTLVSPV